MYTTKIVVNSGTVYINVVTIKLLAMLTVLAELLVHIMLLICGKNIFEKLYNSTTVTKYWAVFEEKLSAFSFGGLTPMFTVMEPHVVDRYPSVTFPKYV